MIRALLVTADSDTSGEDRCNKTLGYGSKLAYFSSGNLAKKKNKKMENLHRKFEGTIILANVKNNRMWISCLFAMCLVNVFFFNLIAL